MSAKTYEDLMVGTWTLQNGSRIIAMLAKDGSIDPDWTSLVPKPPLPDEVDLAADTFAPGALDSLFGPTPKQMPVFGPSDHELNPFSGLRELLTAPRIQGFYPPPSPYDRVSHHEVHGRASRIYVPRAAQMERFLGWSCLVVPSRWAPGYARRRSHPALIMSPLRRSTWGAWQSVQNSERTQGRVEETLSTIEERIDRAQGGLAASLPPRVEDGDEDQVRPLLQSIDETARAQDLVTSQMLPIVPTASYLREHGLVLAQQSIGTDAWNTVQLPDGRTYRVVAFPLDHPQINEVLGAAEVPRVRTTPRIKPAASVAPTSKAPPGGPLGFSIGCTTKPSVVAIPANKAFSLTDVSEAFQYAEAPTVEDTKGTGSALLDNWIAGRPTIYVARGSRGTTAWDRRSIVAETIKKERYRQLLVMEEHLDFVERAQLANAGYIDILPPSGRLYRMIPLEGPEVYAMAPDGDGVLRVYWPLAGSRLYRDEQVVDGNVLVSILRFVQHGEDNFLAHTRAIEEGPAWVEASERSRAYRASLRRERLERAGVTSRLGSLEW